MRSIWVRAGLGALAVFALGMMLYTAVRTTKAKAKAALLQLKTELDSGAAVAFDHADRAVPFVLDGQELGQLTSLTFEPGAGAEAPSLRALVALDREHLDAAMLASCDLVPISPERFEVTQGFRCATPSERGLHSLGEVRFEPVGVVRPVRAGKAALAHLDLNGDSGEIVRIQADSNGAYIHVNDGNGKVVLVRADRSGLVVKVDSNATR